MKSRLSAAKRPLSRGAKRRAFISRAAALLLCCVCTAGMAQSYEVPAWTSFTLTNEAASSMTTPAPTYQWYENGLPVNDATGSSLTIAAGKRVGVYVYTRTVTNAGVCGESNAITVKVKVNPAATVTPTYAASTYAWIVGTQQWSDVIKYSPTGCALRDLTGSSTFSQSTYTFVAEYTVQNGRHYYSWLCATASAATLCDNGWKFPEKNDFDVLIVSIKNSATYNTHTLYTTPSVKEGGRILGEHPDFKWGYGGYVDGLELSTVDTYGNYWSLSPEEGSPSTSAFRLGFTTVGYLNAHRYVKSNGYQVRCVKSK